MEKTITINQHTCRVLISTVPGVPLVFLHGYSFTSNVWKEIDLLSLLKEQRIPFLALDMPYGAKSQCRPKTQEPRANVSMLQGAVTAFFGDQEIFLVGASLGGYIALHYATQSPVKGLMVIAPVGSDQYTLVQRYTRLQNVTIIYGSADTIVSLDDMKTLVHKIPQAELLVYELAGHPAYLHDPKRFQVDLLSSYMRANAKAS